MTSASPEQRRRSWAPWARRLGGALLLIFACLATAWSFFLPALDRLAPRADGPVAALHDALLPDADGPVACIGAGVDQQGTVWTFAQVARMLEGRATLFHPDLFYPVGWDQGGAQGFAWLDAVTAWPLVHGLGEIAFYNLYIFLMLALTQLAVVALCREAGAPWPLAFALSLIALWNPFAIAEIAQGRPTQIHLIFHALFLLFVLRLARPEPRPVRDGVLAGLCLAAAGYVYWFSAVAVGVVGAVGLLLHILAHPRRWRGPVLGGLLLTATAAALVVLPTWRVSGAVLFGDASSVIQSLTRAPHGEISLGPLTLKIMTIRYRVSSLSELWSALTSTGMPGLAVALGAAALAVPLGWRRTLPWALAGLLTVGFPLGSGFRYNDHLLPTAFGATEWLLPALDRCYRAERTLVGPLLGLLAAAAMGGGALLAGVPAKARAAAPWGAAALVALFAWSGRPVQGKIYVGNWMEPPVYAAAASQLPGAIIDVPLNESGLTYVYQLNHGQPLLGGPGVDGPLTRPAEHLAYCQRNSLLAALETLAAGANTMPSYTWADANQLWQDGFRVVVVHLERSSANGYAYRALLGTQPIYIDPRNVAFPLPDPSQYSAGW